MADGIALFTVEPTGRCRLALRRFRFHDEHAGHTHDARVIIGQDEPVTPRNPDGTHGPIPDDRVPHDDPRWPMRCAVCDALFRPADEWQVNEQEWFTGGGHRFAWGIGAWDTGPAGACMRTPWRDHPGRPPSWHVCLPNGQWWNTNDRAARQDGVSQLGPHWNVTGEVPLLTVSPSINDTSPSRPWHGWIRDGRLVGA